jgi:hypothetical protein
MRAGLPLHLLLCLPLRLLLRLRLRLSGRPAPGVPRPHGACAPGGRALLTSIPISVPIADRRRP